MLEENINILPNFEKLLKTLEFFRSNFYHNFQVNTCPIDRGVFQFIIVYNRIGGHEIAREKIKQKVAEDTPAEGNTLMLVYHCHKPVFRPKIAIFLRAEMREGGLPLPLAFQYLILMI